MILNWRETIIHKNKTEEKPSLIVCFTKSNDIFTIHHQLPENIKDSIQTFLLKTNASNKAGETRIYKAPDDFSNDLIVLTCTGENTIEEIRKAGACAIKSVKSLKKTNIQVSNEHFPQELSIGVFLAAYDYAILKKTKPKLLNIQSTSNCQFFERGEKIAFYQNFARFLADTPANLMTPSLFVEYAKDLLKNLNVEINVYDKEYLQENNMNLFLSVGEGSEEPLKFLVIKYKGRESDEIDLSLVGKGITFDSGGISIKPSSGMSDMKADMMGGAAVLSVFGLAADLKKKINLTVSIALTENLPSGKATKPGDVKIGMSGISIEIDNTDAEGRLVLGDALVHAQKENPKYLIDVATLTGAICVALGSVFTGLFCNDEGFCNLIKEAGENVNDLVWRMPLDKKYKELMESNVADMKNSGGREGGSCTAAIFLNEFIDRERKWAHLDVAGVMKNAFPKELYGKGMSGKPVGLIFEIIEKIEKMN
ncbi:hypothetical protein GVAV_000365 [Gurleya vavrai]